MNDSYYYYSHYYYIFDSTCIHRPYVHKWIYKYNIIGSQNGFFHDLPLNKKIWLICVLLTFILPCPYVPQCLCIPSFPLFSFLLPFTYSSSPLLRFLTSFSLSSLSWRRRLHATPVRSPAPRRCRRRWRRSSSTSSSCWPSGTWSEASWPRPRATSVRWRRSWASWRRSTCRYHTRPGIQTVRGHWRELLLLGLRCLMFSCPQYVTDNESTLQQVKALLACTQKDKLELSNQLEEEKR